MCVVIIVIVIVIAIVMVVFFTTHGVSHVPNTNTNLSDLSRTICGHTTTTTLMQMR